MTKKKTIDVEHLRALHGRARVDRAEWYALGRLAVVVRDGWRERKEAALLRALEALEEAQAAERHEQGWNDNIEWLARRIDAAEARRAVKSRLYATAFDFEGREMKHELVATDVDDDEGDIPW